MAQCQLGLVTILMFHFCVADNTTPGTTEDPECSVQDHCSITEACINGKCVDPCIGTCGHNTSCIVSNRIPACACKENYTGNPFLGCSLQEACTTKQHNMKPNSSLNKQYTSCQSKCGKNAICKEMSDECTCPEGFSGDPLNECSSNNDVVKQFYVIKPTEGKLHWSSAEVECNKRGLYLATINNQKEQDDLENVLVAQGVTLHHMVWLAGRRYFDQDDNPHYYWSRTGNEIKYTNWIEHIELDRTDLTCLLAKTELNKTNNVQEAKWIFWYCHGGGYDIYAVCQDREDV